MLVLSPSKWEFSLNKCPTFQRRLLRKSIPCLKVLRRLSLSGAQNGEQQGVRESWVPWRLAAMGSQFPLLVHLSLYPTCMNSCPVPGPGHSTGVKGIAHPKSHYLLLGWQERLPQPGPAPGSLSGVSTGDQDLRPCWAVA